MYLRVARHTNNLKKIEDFYIVILGFQRLGSFQNHNTYDGVFIGKPNLDWHFEFTQSTNPAHHVFDDDDLLALYPKSTTEYTLLIERLIKSGIEIQNAINPYWQENGKMFLDPDGYRIVVCPQKIENN